MLTELKTSLGILEDNFWELEKARDSYISNNLLWNLDLPEPERAKICVSFSKLFSRLFNNYLFSFDSLFEHIVLAAPNVIENNYFSKDTDQKRKEFLKVPENCLIIDLRNMAGHRKLPIAGIGIDMMYSFENGLLKPCGITKCSPTLIVKDLLSRVRPPSKQLLARSGREIQIIPLVEVTFHNLKELNLWADRSISSL